jgi:hypothetical protein
MSDTPRTDAARFYYNTDDEVVWPEDMEVVERALNAAEEEIERLKLILSHHEL